MKKRLIFIVLIFLIVACKKANERTCFKSAGNYSELVIPFDNYTSFKLYKNLKYTLYQDTLNYLRIKGGENLIGLVDILVEDNSLIIQNENRCNFFRKYESIIEVEIHAINFRSIYVEPSDSVIFKNQIVGDSLNVEIRNGGGSLYLNTIQDFISINVSHGTGDYVLKGNANSGEIKIQNNGFADASQFEIGYLFGYNNSTGDLKLNLNNTSAQLLLEGTGNIIYTGAPQQINSVLVGAGKIIKQ